MITVSNLTKKYSSTTVVDDICFRAEAGRVTGFLGGNGAGKSTTMRMICGMTAPTSGSALVLGERFRDLVNPGRRIGVLLDAGAQHMGRTGREALTLSALQMGLPRRRVDEVLDLVQLDRKAAGKRVGAYSLGMRQRLGIANALLGSPSVLMLDEPSNGLDPSGIRWMRTLLRSFADDGGTVLLGSHLLREVELIADDVVVIAAGRILARGDVAEFTAAGSRSLEDVFFSLTTDASAA
ncbi:ABC transporter ATP-binding protein [Tessaracoccus sp. Y36]